MTVWKSWGKCCLRINFLASLTSAHWYTHCRKSSETERRNERSAFTSQKSSSSFEATTTYEWKNQLLFQRVKLAVSCFENVAKKHLFPTKCSFVFIRLLSESNRLQPSIFRTSCCQLNSFNFSVFDLFDCHNGNKPKGPYLQDIWNGSTSVHEKIVEITENYFDIISQRQLIYGSKCG